MTGNRSRTEERLKEAAIRVWARNGFHGASVKMIADEAGANVALINRYFGGKEGLLQHLVRDMIREKQSGELDYPPQTTFSDEVREYLRFRYREDMARRDLVRIVISEVATNDSFREEALKSMNYAGDRNFRDRLAALQARGRIRQSSSLTDLFRQIALFSFSCSFIEGIVLGLDPDGTDRIMCEFARVLADAHAS
jgi:TetR/AcrR family transcriptional regulator, regulator of cefoperazone and chloramphenicol sensitivity